MTHSLTPRAQSSDVDIAYQLLMSQGRSMYYYDLIQGVLQIRNVPMDPQQISSVLTQINLDTRFAYVGRGEWGLKAWVPSRGTRKLPTISLMNKEITYDDDSELGEDKDLLIDDELDEEIDEEEIEAAEDEDVGSPRRSDDDSWD